MTSKGVAVRMSSYVDSVPKVLKLIKLDSELQKHERIIIKVHLIPGSLAQSTKPEFVEQIIIYCLAHKSPSTEIVIAEGCDGFDTRTVFDEHGFTKLAEKYGVGLIDLNETGTVQVQSPDFLRFEWIHYPEVLLNSFVIVASSLSPHEELGMSASLDTMRGAFPAKHYKGFFASNKSKLAKYPLKYQIHDILKCKMPELAIIDAIEKGLLIVGRPLDMDKQATKVLGLDWMKVPHLRLIDESFSSQKKEDAVDDLIGSVPTESEKKQ